MRRSGLTDPPSLDPSSTMAITQPLCHLSQRSAESGQWLVAAATADSDNLQPRLGERR